MSILATIPPYILNNRNLLWESLERRLCDLPILLGGDHLRDMVMLDYHHWNHHYPDHVPLNLWDAYQQQRKMPTPDGARRLRETPGIVPEALDCLCVEYVERDGNEAYVRAKEYGWWQNMVSKVSPLPLIAYARVKYGERCKLSPRPHEPAVEDYINRYGLNDTHLHLKLCASGEECWLQALREPCKEYHDQQYSYRSKRHLAELFRQIHPELTPKILQRHLEVAKAIREVLIRAVCNRGRLGTIPAAKRLKYWRERDLPYDNLSCESLRLSRLKPTPDIRTEIEWMQRLLQMQRDHYQRDLDCLLHVYILLLNEYRSLYTQSENCVGFRQFQKNSDASRPIVGSVRYYRDSFLHMHGDERNSFTHYANTRIAPKADAGRLRKEISAVLTGYLCYLIRINHIYGQKKHRCAPSHPLQPYRLIRCLEKELLSIPHDVRIVKPEITFHFIKQEYQLSGAAGGKSADVLPAPHYDALRNRYMRECRALKLVLKGCPPLRHWIGGVDAAAYEMDTPPDVFAPVFREARNNTHLLHATYHVGEDFVHLVSGMRAMRDAIDFLGLRNGDRLGHGTALGIAPELWLQTMPNSLATKRGEWLQDLVFAWEALQHPPGTQSTVAKLERDIIHNAGRIFGHGKFTPHSISRAFRLLKLDPRLYKIVHRKAQIAAIRQLGSAAGLKPRDIFYHARCLKESDFGFKEENMHEVRAVLGALDKEPDDVLDILFHWQFSKRVWACRQEAEMVPTDYFSAEELVYLQQHVARLVGDSGLVVETLPTSNVRISQYRAMREHHSLRWLGVGEHCMEGDVPLMVSLGDDDPGVFATDIRGEFYHLFSALRKSGLNSREALRKMAEINECGQQYAFRLLANSPDPQFRAHGHL